MPLPEPCLRGERLRCLLTSPGGVGDGTWEAYLVFFSTAMAECCYAAPVLAEKDALMEALTLLRGWAHFNTLQSFARRPCWSGEVLCNQVTFKVTLSKLNGLVLWVNVASLWLATATWGEVRLLQRVPSQQRGYVKRLGGCETSGTLTGRLHLFIFDLTTTRSIWVVRLLVTTITGWLLLRTEPLVLKIIPT